MIPTSFSLPVLLILTIPCTHAGYLSVSPKEFFMHSFGRRGESSSTRNVPEQGYYDPRSNGGSMLTKIPVTYPMGQGEPINAIITGNSDAQVLKDQEADGGLRNYFLSLGFSDQCLGQRSVDEQAANLGDGNGDKNETATIRWNYGDPQLGTCKETVQGGNHFRYWVQDGQNANSGAVFMAVSYEKPLNEGHDIVVNGYNLGRDWLIGNITNTTVPTLNLTDGLTYSESTWSAGYEYQNNIKYITGLLENTNDGINHNITVGGPSFNSTDGFTVLIEVNLLTKPAKNSAASSIASSPLWQPSVVLAIPFIVLLL